MATIITPVATIFFSWEEKLPNSNTPLETTWLNHEIGRCYLEKGKYDTAKDYGERSMSAAQESGDKVWQLNASVLIAQALGMYVVMVIIGCLVTPRNLMLTVLGNSMFTITCLRPLIHVCFLESGIDL